MNNNESISVKLIPEAIRDIELFVDAICDQLFINDTYYGNILMSLTELFNCLLESNKNDDNVTIKYNSDHTNITISFYPIDSQLIKALSRPISVDEVVQTESNKNIFLINSLVDKVIVDDTNQLSFEFDISALHNKIYYQRANLLKAYFSKQSIKKVQTV